MVAELQPPIGHPDLAATPRVCNRLPAPSSKRAMKSQNPTPMLTRLRSFGSSQNSTSRTRRILRQPLSTRAVDPRTLGPNTYS